MDNEFEETVWAGQDSKKQSEKKEELSPEKRKELLEKSEKGQELFKKVANLCKKVETEKSPFKRQVLAASLRSLQSRIEKEIEIQKIKNKYDKERTKLKTNIDVDKRKREKTIAQETKNIKNLYQQIGSIAEYDYESENFLFDDKTVEEYGGIDGLIEAYENSGDEELIETAQNIKEARQAREDLKTSKINLAQARKEDIDKSHKKEEKKIKKEEKGLIKKEKGNIFQRLSGFFKNVKQGVKNYLDERKQVKEEANKIYEANAKKSFKNTRQSILDDLNVDINDWSTVKPEERGSDNPEKEQEQEL